METETAHCARLLGRGEAGRRERGCADGGREPLFFVTVRRISERWAPVEVRQEPPRSAGERPRPEYVGGPMEREAS